MNPTTNDLSIHDLGAPPQRPSRQWRVGTLSMGLSLLILGLLVLSSAWKSAEVYSSAVKWWPIIFVLLGAEIVTYTLIFRKNEGLKYDLFSILLISFLAFCCIGMAALSATGVLEQIRRETTAIRQSIPLPDQTFAIPDGITKVIIQGSYHHQIHHDASSSKEMLVFGSLHTSDAEKIWKTADLPALIQTKQSGNIMYVQLSDPPQYEFGGSASQFDLTVSVPSSVKVIVRGPSS